MNLPMLGNLVWMNAAEDQQMVVFGQVMERLDRCPEAFVLVEEPKTPISTASSGKASSIGKLWREALACTASTSALPRNASG